MSASPAILRNLRSIAHGKKPNPGVLQELIHDGYVVVDEYESPQFTPKAAAALRDAP